MNDTRKNQFSSDIHNIFHESTKRLIFRPFHIPFNEDPNLPPKSVNSYVLPLQPPHKYLTNALPTRNPDTLTTIYLFIYTRNVKDPLLLRSSAAVLDGVNHSGVPGFVLVGNGKGRDSGVFVFVIRGHVGRIVDHWGRILRVII